MVAVVGGQADEKRLRNREMSDQDQVLLRRAGGADSVLSAAEGIGVLEEVVGQEVFDQVRMTVEERAGVVAVGR